jgi:hypothetical protein
VGLTDGGLHERQEVMRPVGADDRHELVHQRDEMEALVNETPQGETVLAQPDLASAELPQVAILADQPKDEGVHRSAEFEDSLSGECHSANGDAVVVMVRRWGLVPPQWLPSGSLAGPVLGAVCGSRTATHISRAGRVIPTVAMNSPQPLTTFGTGSLGISSISCVSTISNVADAI